MLPEEVRAARETLASAQAPGHHALQQLLESIERDLRIAKAALATELRLPLCQCCWPPEMMTTDGEGNDQCSARWKDEPTQWAA